MYFQLNCPHIMLEMKASLRQNIGNNKTFSGEMLRILFFAPMQTFWIRLV